MMKTVQGDPLREYVLGDVDLEAASNFLAALMQCLETQGTLNVAGTQSQVAVPSAALPPLIDLLSLLLTKRSAVTFVLDRHEDLVPFEIGRLLGVPERKVSQFIKDGTFKGRDTGRHQRMAMADVLALVGTGRYDRKRQTWVSAQPDLSLAEPITEPNP
jgi:hypothetical protein